MHLNNYLLILCLLFSVSPLLHAQLTPQQAIVEMGRGINLGNTLEPPTEGEWNNGPAEEKYFDAYVEAGFMNVRIPVRWDEHTGDAAPYTVDAAWMDRVEEVVDWGLDRDLYVVLNGHHEDWLKTGYENPDFRARYDSIWVQISERFRDKSDKLIFEIINEPNGLTVAQNDELNARILGIIRQTNPTRIVIFGGNNYANSAELIAAAIPDDPYLIGYFHSYDPWEFAGMGNGTWGTESDYRALDQKFAAVADWSTANDVPVHLSEFGAVLTADYNSRMRWYAAYVEASLRYGFAFSVWDDGGSFGILNREENTWPEVKDILIYTYEDSPTDVVATASDPADSVTVRVDLSWTNRNSDQDIDVQRRIGEGEFTSVATVDAGTTSYTDTGVSIGNFYTYRLVTTRNDGTILESYPARVLLAGEQLPYGAAAISIPDTLQAEDFDRGGEGVAYHDSEATNIPGEYRPDEGVDIDGNGMGGYAVGYLAQREWLEYTVNVAEAGTYAVTASVASSVGGGRMQISASANSALTTVVVPEDGTGGFDAFEAVRSNGLILLDSGEQVLRIDITGTEAFNLDYLVFTAEAGDSNAIVNYSDNLDTAANRFSGTPAGITYSVADGVLTIAGDGTAPTYQVFSYNMPDSLLANVTASGNRLYISARTLSGNSANLRIDLIDDNNYATTLAGRTQNIAGAEFTEYLFDYTNGYEDGGYGGTGCTDGAPCPVDGSRIVALGFYLDPADGGFNDTVQIDYLSFGQPLGGGNPGEVGVVNYQDDLTDAGASFQGEPSGLTYGVTDGVLAITGDGSAGAYQNFRYTVQSMNGGIALADAVGSNDLLYISARTVGGDTANLRIDLVDADNYHTTTANRNVDIGGSEFATYTLNYAGGYADGGYGGTACSSDVAPCPVDGQRIKQLVFYPEAADGGFNGTIEIDWISFGTELTVNVRDFAELDRLSVYPNPASDRLNIAYQLTMGSDVAVELYDATGRRLLIRELGMQHAGAQLAVLPVGDLVTGTYFARLRVGAHMTRAFPVQVR